VPNVRRLTFHIALRPEPGNSDPERSLRAMLKTALRRYGLRCITAEASEDTDQNIPQQETDT
jgi:hypothetical protein